MNERKAPGKQFDEIEINNLTDKEFKVMVIEMLMNSGERCMNTVITST